jgi:hypothetical protein
LNLKHNTHGKEIFAKFSVSSLRKLFFAKTVLFSKLCASEKIHLKCLMQHFQNILEWKGKKWQNTCKINYCHHAKMATAAKQSSLEQAINRSIPV